MIKEEKMCKKTYEETEMRYIISFFFLSGILIGAGRTYQNFARWYTETIYPMFPETMGRLSSLLPFSIFELLTLVLILLLSMSMLGLVRILWLRNKDSRGKINLWIKRSFALTGVLLLLFSMTAAVNYHRTPIAETAGLSLRESSVEELVRLNLILIDDLNRLKDQVDRDDQGLYQLQEKQVVPQVREAMMRLGDRYVSLSGYYPKPKPILLSRGMSYLGLTGIFSPFTLEANYNRSVPDYVIPYTIAHELAHTKGYMKEEEAGFLAYLACRDSNLAELQYSAAMNGLVYAINALYQNAGTEEFQAVMDQIPEEIKIEIGASNTYWQAHTIRLTKIAEIANDRYLMANAQEAGIKSYGLMVDLLLAEYAGQHPLGTLL